MTTTIKVVSCLDSGDTMVSVLEQQPILVARLKDILGLTNPKPIINPISGQLLVTYCTLSTKYGVHADGVGGAYFSVIEYNCPECLLRPIV